MADRPSSPENEGDAHRVPDGGAATNRPRWGLVLVVIVAIALVGLMVFLHLTGTLGPGLH
jgi:hypothetical protein